MHLESVGALLVGRRERLEAVGRQPGLELGEAVVEGSLVEEGAELAVRLGGEALLDHREALLQRVLGERQLVAVVALVRVQGGEGGAPCGHTPGDQGRLGVEDALLVGGEEAIEAIDP